MDCHFTQDDRVFRYRAVGIIVEQGHLLLATNTLASYYYTIGGAVGHKETSIEALEREVFKETGIRYEVDRFLTIVENFFDYELGGTRYDFHEIALYYLMKPQGMKQINALKDIGSGRIQRVEWLPLGRLDRYTIKPEVVREIVADLDSVEIPIIDRMNG